MSVEFRNLYVMPFLVEEFQTKYASMKRTLQVLVSALVMTFTWGLTRASEPANSSGLPIPAAVQSAVRTVAPNLEIARAEWDKDNYRVKLTGPEESERVTLSPDGVIRSVEWELRHATLPARVRRAIQKAFPDDKLGDAVKLTRTEVSYSVEVDHQNLKREVRLTADGKLLEVERK